MARPPVVDVAPAVQTGVVLLLESGSGPRSLLQAEVARGKGCAPGGLGPQVVGARAH